MATFWEIVAHLVNHMFSFVFCLSEYSVISRFDFEGLIWVLTAQVPDPCILLTFSGQFLRSFVFLFTLLLLYLT